MPRIISEINGVTIFAEKQLPFGDALPFLFDSMDMLKKMKGKKIIDIFKLYDRAPSWYLAKQFIFPSDQLFKHAGGPVLLRLQYSVNRWTDF